MQVMGQDMIKKLAENSLRKANEQKNKALIYDDFLIRLLEIAQDESRFKDDDVRITPTSFSRPKSEKDKTVCLAPPVSFMISKIRKNKSKLDKLLSTVDKAAEAEMKKFFYRELFKEDVKYLTFETPPTIMCGDGVERPIWFNKTQRGINIRTGFEDGDRNKPTPLVLADDTVHSKGGGITGSGKSVMINDWLMTLLLEYPPHELKLWLMDFKKVELTRYAVPVETPHAEVIAATESPDYLISLFETIRQECADTQEVLTALGLQHVREVEEVYGFIIPRNLILVDEFTQLFENIKEDQDAQDKVNEAISYIARIGRNAGFHMELTSQSLDGVLKENIAKQFKGGTALMSDKSTSKQLIGNESASLLQGKGWAIQNTGKDSTEAGNQKFAVPYIPSELSDEQVLANERIIAKMSQTQDPEERRALADQMQNSYLTKMLVQLYEISRDKKDYRRVKFFDQAAQRDWEVVDESIVPKLKDNFSKIYKAREFIEQVFFLGDISMFKGDSTVELLQSQVGANNNIAVLTDNLDMMYYGMKMMYLNMTTLSPVPTVSHLVRSDMIAVSQYIKDHNFKFDRIHNEFPFDVYRTKVDGRKQMVIISQYLLDNGLDNTLKNFNSAQTYVGIPDEVSSSEAAKDFLLNYGHIVVTGNEDKLEDVYANEEVALTALKGLEADDYSLLNILFLDCQFFTSLLNDNNGINARSFPREVFYIYGLDKEESISGIDADGMMLKNVFKDGTQYGIYVVFLTTMPLGLNRIVNSIGYIMDRTNNMDLYTAVNLKKKIYYEEHFMRFTNMKNISNETLIVKTYRLDMDKELGSVGESIEDLLDIRL